LCEVKRARVHAFAALTAPKQDCPTHARDGMVIVTTQQPTRSGGTAKAADTLWFGGAHDRQDPPAGAPLARSMPMSIRSRLLLLVLSVLVPGMLGVAWLVAHTFKAERLANERALRDTARALSMVVDQELGQRAMRVRLLAQSRWLDEPPPLTPQALASFQQQAQQALNGLDGWIELRAPGQKLFDTRQGSPLTPAAANGPLSDVAQIRPLHTGDGLQGAYAELVEPVQRDAETVFNLVLTLTPIELQRIVDAQALPDGRVAAVLDSRGVVVARHPGGGAYVGRSATPDLQARLASRREGLFESTSLDGQALVGYFSTSPHGWTYLSAMSTEQFAGLLPQAVTRVLAGALALLTLAIVGALWVSRRIVAPVQALKVAAARLQSGDVVEAHTTGIVECDEVAAALADSSKVIRDARHDLERQVAQAVERTRVAEQRVSQGQRVEALGRLTGGVAHDFNNLLGVISNSAHLIERLTAANPQLKMPVAATLRAVEAGSRLTQHLLRFAGQRPVRPQALYLEHALPDLKELMRSVVGRTIDVSLDVAPGTGPAQVDPGELELALVNLALNARDAMPSGGTLQLRARNASSDDSEGLPSGRYVLLTVRDDGLGMSAEAVEHAFDPFFTTKAIGKGTGLGLSQVHGFCVQAGGTARLASTPGVGTTVSLLLPASTNAAAPDAPAASHGAAGEAAASPALAHARVLLVDDNQALARVTAALLQAHGARVERLDNAADALHRIDETPDAFDAVLSDIVMPGAIDGLELARQLRRHHPTLPVVLLSGFSVAEGTREFVVLRKPCSEREMLGALTDALRASRPSPQQ
jgi:signal transduction histidine kinase